MFTSYLKSTNDYQSMDVELCNVLADFFQLFTWQNSLGHRHKRHSESYCSFKIKAVPLEIK